MDIYSWNIHNCRTIYPHRLVRPLKKKSVENKEQLRDVIQDITENDIRIAQFIADNLKRSDAKDCKCHSSWYPCEYCFAKGTKIFITDNETAKKKLNNKYL